MFIKIKRFTFNQVSPFFVILKNAGSMTGTTLITSGLGFFYWWLAARQFLPEVVGLASASISAMLLLGAIGIFGFGTLLMGELRQQKDQAGHLITTALITVGLAGTLIGLLFVWSISWIDSDLLIWTESLRNSLIFCSAVGLTSIVLVLDQALIGLLRGSLQLWRNTIFAVAKLGLLFLISIVIPRVSAISIYLTWMAGNLISLAILLSYIVIKGEKIHLYRPNLNFLRKFGTKALSHHVLNLALQIPGLALPVIVTIILSSRLNAYFYAAWMIASLIFAVPIALATVLYAVDSSDRVIQVNEFRFSLKLSGLFGLIACTVVMIMGEWVLHLFGPSYASQASWCLRILSLAVFPIAVKNHYVAVHRIRNKMLVATRLVIIGSIFELLFSIVGGKIGGLIGISIGWTFAVFLEGLLMSRTVYQAINNKKELDGQILDEIVIPTKEL